MALEDDTAEARREFEDSCPTHALPSDSVVNDILRYEAAAEKKFDWALQKLLESQAAATEGPGASERLGFKRSLGCCRGVRPAPSSSAPTKV